MPSTPFALVKRPRASNVGRRVNSGVAITLIKERRSWHVSIQHRRSTGRNANLSNKYPARYRNDPSCEVHVFCLTLLSTALMPVSLSTSFTRTILGTGVQSRKLGACCQRFTLYDVANRVCVDHVQTGQRPSRSCGTPWQRSASKSSGKPALSSAA